MRASLFPRTVLEVVFCHRKPTPQTEENFGPQHMAGDQSMDPLHLFLHGEMVHDFDEMPSSFSMHSHVGTAAAAAAAATVTMQNEIPQTLPKMVRSNNMHCHE